LLDVPGTALAALAEHARIELRERVTASRRALEPVARPRGIPGDPQTLRVAAAEIALSAHLTARSGHVNWRPIMLAV
jgi:hypothetical protein